MFVTDIRKQLASGVLAVDASFLYNESVYIEDEQPVIGMFTKIGKPE